MIKVRKRDEIYSKEGGWFSARWHFSFDEYYDPEYMVSARCACLTTTA